MLLLSEKARPPPDCILWMGFLMAKYEQSVKGNVLAYLIVAVPNHNYPK